MSLRCTEVNGELMLLYLVYRLCVLASETATGEVGY